MGGNPFDAFVNLFFCLVLNNSYSCNLKTSKQAGDSACSLRSQRNGEACRREQGEMGGEGKGSGNGTPQPAAHLPFFSPLAAHHSAKRDSVERNLRVMCDLRGAICDLRFTKWV